MTRWVQDDDGHIVRDPDSPPLTDAEKEERRRRILWPPGSDVFRGSPEDEYRAQVLTSRALEAEREANGVPGPSEAPRVQTSEDVKGRPRRRP